MKLKHLSIKNFRNFQNVDIELYNKNVVFGMNDVGKTNYLYALRFLLDRDVRKNGFVITDYHKTNVDDNIEITLTIDLTDFDESEDTKKLVAQIRSGETRTSNGGDIFYLRVEGEYNEAELFGVPVMKWGDDLNNLKDMPGKGGFYAVDEVFKLIYVNPLIDLESLFAKNKRLILDEGNNTDEDKEIIQNIKNLTNQVNEQIGQMTVINSFQVEITEEYKRLKNENIEIEMKSEMAIKGFFSDIIPYIKKNGDCNYYPTSGDGRRKLLAYSILNYLNKKLYEDKILIYLVEEPENNLHRAMQIALSKQFFSEDIYSYLFVSTHSPEILYEMDNARLIRIYSQDRIECSSYLYKVDQDYKNVKRKLNRGLANALFAERVLLVEGPSEKVLFEKVMDAIKPEYELDGGYILEVAGINFKPYLNALKGLNINAIVKTDNDLKTKRGSNNEYELLGLNRGLHLINKPSLENISINFKKGTTEKAKELALKKKKLELYSIHEEKLTELKENKIFLSRIDLENDLFNVIGSRMSAILGKDLKKVVDYLQDSKLYNMVTLVEGLEREDCEKIYNSDEFNCLKELI